MAGLRTEVLEVKTIVTNAGLNGHTDELKKFLDNMADDTAGWAWFRRKLGVGARLNFALKVIGSLSAIAWAILALHSVFNLLNIPPH